MERRLTIDLPLDSVTPTPQELADFTELRSALAALDGVTSGAGVDHTRIRPGVAYAAVDVSQVVATIGPSVVGSGLVTVLVEWLRGRAGRSARLKIGDREIELTNASDETQKRLLGIFEDED